MITVYFTRRFKCHWTFLCEQHRRSHQGIFPATDMFDGETASHRCLMKAKDLRISQPNIVPSCSTADPDDSFWLQLVDGTMNSPEIITRAWIPRNQRALTSSSFNRKVHPSSKIKSHFNYCDKRKEKKKLNEGKKNTFYKSDCRVKAKKTGKINCDD